MRRMTRQRAAIWDTLGQTDEFRSAQQLHDALGERGESIGLATVYRALQALAESDDVDVLRTADGENLFPLSILKLNPLGQLSSG